MKQEKVLVYVPNEMVKSYYIILIDIILNKY